MKKKINKKTDSNEPVGKLTRVEDFLPSPDELFSEEDELERVTLYLDKKVVDFFKENADKKGTKYQKMIRKLLRSYCDKFGKKSA